MRKSLLVVVGRQRNWLCYYHEASEANYWLAG